jgi:hypothetical protein
MFLWDHHTGGVPAIYVYAVITGDGDFIGAYPSHREACEAADRLEPLAGIQRCVLADEDAVAAGLPPGSVEEL